MMSNHYLIALVILVFSLVSATPVVVTADQYEESQSGSTRVQHTDGQKKNHLDAEQHGATAEPSEHEVGLGANLPVWSVIPFLGILLSIAIFPLVAPHFWHDHFPKISALWALIFAIPFLLAYGDLAFHEIAHIYLKDYFPFIILLWGLFTVSGGIFIQGSLRGTPLLNTLLIFIGTFFASWIGTTGAAMVMIRPLLRANEDRRHKVHTVVFFIFLVANIGGSLTPLGDPPLFLGFLHNVPFFWTLKLLPEMAFVASILLVIYLALDTWFYRREDTFIPEPSPEDPVVPLRILGWHNFIFLMGIMGSVLLSGTWSPGSVTILGIHVGIQNLARDGLILLMGWLSLTSTREKIHEKNEFGWFPIKEVAYLFAGIFMTIIPALAILKAGEKGGFSFIITSMESPVHYFWVTGILSSFLDNAPTYLTFFNSALGSFYAGIPEPQAVQNLIATHEIYLKAISTGAVFFGAFTYIGNAPNFMVKSIAEERGIDMPSFFGYMAKYSIPVLLIVFFLVTLIFF